MVTILVCGSTPSGTRRPVWTAYMLPPARPPGLRWLQARAAAPGIEPHIIFMLLILPFQNIKIALHPTLSNSTINKSGGWFRIPSPIFETGRRTNGEFSSLHPLNYRYQTTACLNSCNARYLVMLFTHMPKPRSLRQVFSGAILLLLVSRIPVATSWPTAGRKFATNTSFQIHCL